MRYDVISFRPHAANWPLHTRTWTIRDPFGMGRQERSYGSRFRASSAVEGRRSYRRNSHPAKMRWLNSAAQGWIDRLRLRVSLAHSSLSVTRHLAMKVCLSFSCILHHMLQMQTHTQGCGQVQHDAAPEVLADLVEHATAVAQVPPSVLPRFAPPTCPACSYSGSPTGAPGTGASGGRGLSGSR